FLPRSLSSCKPPVCERRSQRKCHTRKRVESSGALTEERKPGKNGGSEGDEGGAKQCQRDDHVIAALARHRVEKRRGDVAAGEAAEVRVVVDAREDHAEDNR